jgi:hypothetical protein
MQFGTLCMDRCGQCGGEESVLECVHRTVCWSVLIRECVGVSS